MIIAQSDSVSFRRMTEADLDYVTAIEHAAAQERFVSEWTRAQHQQALHEPDRLHLIIESVSDGRPVGFILLDAVTSADRNIEFQRIVVEPQGQGRGRQAIRLLKSYAFDELGAQRLWLDVEPFNERARTLYRSEGFEEVGDLSENPAGAPKGYPLIVMAILRDNQRAAKARS